MDWYEIIAVIVGWEIGKFIARGIRIVLTAEAY